MSEFALKEVAGGLGVYYTPVSPFCDLAGNRRQTAVRRCHLALQ